MSDSNIIKSSKITGEYRLSEKKAKEKQKKDQEKTRRNREQKLDDELKSRREKILAEAESEAEEILEEARQKADAIISEAKEEAEEIKKEAAEAGREQGYEDGYEQGEEKVREDLRQEHEDSLAAVTEAVEKTEEQLVSEMDRIPEKVVNLSLQIAERIVQSSLEVQPDLIIPIVEDCLEEVGLNHNKLTIKVAPGVDVYLSDLSYPQAPNTDIEIVPDGNLEKGDCLVETEFGGRDATIENKLNLLRKKLVNNKAKFARNEDSD